MLFRSGRLFFALRVYSLPCRSFPALGFCCFCYNGQAQENLQTPVGNLFAIRERTKTNYRNAFKYAEDKGRFESEARGRAEGRAEGGLEMLFSLVRDGLLSMEKASARAGMTESSLRRG